MLGFKELGMVFLVERIVLVLFALRLDNEIEGAVSSPKNIRTDAVDLLRPFRFKAKECAEVGKRFLVTAD
jgi:hypothetical protein